MSSASAGCCYGPGGAQCCDHLALGDRILVLAELEFADEAADRDAEADGAFRELGAVVGIEPHRVIDVAFEVRDEPGEDLQVGRVVEDLRCAVAVGGTEVPGRGADRSGRVPAGADVAVTPLNDQQDLAVAEPVDLLVGASDVGEHGELGGVVVEEDRVVGGDQLAVVVADERGPGVLPDHLPDDVRIGRGVHGVVSHPVLRSVGGNVPDTPPVPASTR
jgi:hypothetical protein